MHVLGTFSHLWIVTPGFWEGKSARRHSSYLSSDFDRHFLPIHSQINKHRELPRLILGP